MRRYSTVRQIDATHAMMENITYQMCTMTKEESAKALAGITALAKVQSTKVFEYCARAGGGAPLHSPQCFAHRTPVHTRRILCSGLTPVPGVA